MNSAAFRKAVIVGVLMVVAGGLAFAAKPRVKVAELGPKVDLEAMIPRSFGDWAVDERVVPVSPAPDLQEKLNRIYNQTLARTYVNSRGERVMLSIAYGGDQSDAMQVHKPELCYPAQGFSILKNVKGYMTTQYGVLPVTRLVAVLGSRVEPITYWITVGDRVAHPGWERKLVQLRYGLTGVVPDGMIIRISNISKDQVEAYGRHDQFAIDLLHSLSSPALRQLAGRALDS